MKETSGSETVCTKLERIAELARQAPTMVLTTLAHHIDLDWMREAYRRTRKDGAPGVDRQTAEQYAEQLEDNLRSLLERAKAGTYRAPPVRRVHIPKGNGETRPIGIPIFEDKILQRAVAMVLEAVFEQDFLDCSYGFRPGRSAHRALASFWDKAMEMAGGWVIEVDIRRFFDTVDRQHLMDALRRRVRDGVLLRLISKWLHAGVHEDGSLSYPEAGTPQGGVVSPILANIYLHEVLDTWFERDVRPRLRGRVHLIRYADDAVLLFEVEEDARRVMAVLPKRFGKYGLSLHPDKTRLLPFQRPPKRPPPSGGASPMWPSTFDLLGFMHHWGRSRRGNWAIKRRTAKDRFSRALRRVAEWCRDHMHEELSSQQGSLAMKLRGHYEYYGITGNSEALRRFAWEVVAVWRKWLDRRSQNAKMTWERMHRLLERYPLPRPRIRHPAPARS
ncbi:group II intron reverse transcriptase/maturase [Sorangium sp. So ce590]|uniref:group II intron reverse transcriptase/maturase n=1 Tax=Sorangium sp. So ce590 TaxID=3133317 RepID=UPI003F624016